MRKGSFGVTIPLFSLRRDGDHGIGDLAGLASFAALAQEAGAAFLQVLPPHVLLGGETSPYGAVSAFALDPVYIALDRVPELAGKRFPADPGASHSVDYAQVRALKGAALAEAAAAFAALPPNDPRNQEFQRFLAAEDATWLDDYALYVVARDVHAVWRFTDFPAPLRDRDPGAIAAFRAEHTTAIDAAKYIQFLAFEQWAAAREELARLPGGPVRLFGDLPFMVARDGADVWADPATFTMEGSLGVPPDPFSAEGQDWQLPTWNIETLRRSNYAFFQKRIAHSRKLYDGFRLDHVLGYFRQWRWFSKPVAGSAAIRQKDGSSLHGVFTPADEPSQNALGRELLGVLQKLAGDGVILAEDLGTVPDFVPPALDALGLPGYKVLPWTREKNGTITDPAAYPENAVATFSTHDTAPLEGFYAEFAEVDKHRLAHLIGRYRLNAWESATTRRDGVFALFADSPARWVLALAQELLGVSDRINVPGVVGDGNWSWRLPATADALRADPTIAQALATVRARMEAAGRA
jgi:4-alpha-glucanotransferase